MFALCTSRMFPFHAKLAIKEYSQKFALPFMNTFHEAISGAFLRPMSSFFGHYKRGTILKTFCLSPYKAKPSQNGFYSTGKTLFLGSKFFPSRTDPH